MGKQRQQTIPRYYLYGDAASEVELDFLHVEAIPERSGPNDWTIRAHAHPDHVQLLYVDQGGGEIRIEAEAYQIGLPSLIVVPAAMVHEISFLPGTDGFVITAATAFANAAVQGDARFTEALGRPGPCPLPPGDPATLELCEQFTWLRREYVWTAPGRRLAIMAHFQRILVAVMRLQMERGASSVVGADRDYDILGRYRELLETNFRTERGLEFYAAELGVSAQRLNLACKARAGKTASEILHERIVIEAKRCLIYLEKSVAEVGYDLGFDDPAYFSRFFSQRVGVPPGAFRDARQNERHRA